MDFDGDLYQVLFIHNDCPSPSMSKTDFRREKRKRALQI